MVKTMRPRILFVTLAELGHATFTARLKEFADSDRRIEATWLYIKPLSEARYFWERAGRWLPHHFAYSLLVRRRVKELLKKRDGFDAFFVHTYDRGLFLPPLGDQKILILGLDSTSYLTRMLSGTNHTNILRQAPRWLYRKISVYLEHRVIKKADLLVSWSKWAAQSLIDDYQVPEGKIIIVPPAMAKRNTKYTARRKESGGKLRLLFVGGEFKRKGGEMLVTLMNEGLGGVCELDIVTKDKVECSSECIRVHRGLEHDSPVLAELFSAADVFVLPTNWDMLGIVLIEASAAGLPCIATNIAGIPEVIEDGRSGILIPPNDKAALRAAIERFVSDRSLCHTMGAYARTLFEQRFTAEENFPKLFGIICKLVDQKRAAPAAVSKLP
jgi:glycosyltransferase involved in cell wall biosynthesis